MESLYRLIFSTQHLLAMFYPTISFLSWHNRKQLNTILARSLQYPANNKCSHWNDHRHTWTRVVECVLLIMFTVNGFKTTITLDKIFTGVAFTQQVRRQTRHFNNLQQFNYNISQLASITTGLRISYCLCNVASVVTIDIVNTIKMLFK